MSATPPAGAALTPAQAKKLALWRRLVMGCLWGAAAVLVVEGVLLVWPGVGRTAKLVGIAVFIEFAVATVILGALGRCPACNSSFEAPPGELLPERCRQCGVVLQTRRKR
jgi:hypothetical protein